MRKGREKGPCRLSVFKGREAKLNKAIFHTLTLKSPQTAWDIFKEVKAQRGMRYIRYASINKRVKALEESGYINRKGSKTTKAGFEAPLYELTDRIYLAMLLALTDLNALIRESDENTVATILAVIAHARSS